jgi:hypothetical protein
LRLVNKEIYPQTLCECAVGVTKQIIMEEKQKLFHGSFKSVIGHCISAKSKPYTRNQKSTIYSRSCNPASFEVFLENRSFLKEKKRICKKNMYLKN